ncbi:MAG: phage shock protein operon transcriptional activator [Candidatus Hydrogenedentota bacterium]
MYTSQPQGTSPIDAQEALGQSEAFLAFQERISAVAPVDRPVLLVGERGTGKELAARRLHFLSQRWDQPLAALNCASLAPTLIESELFGHEAGAFTGATSRRPGRFEAADGGTMFLDELGHLPLEVQEKLLRVVEYGQFERVGGSGPVQVDVRLVGATNADLPRLAEEGRFMPDLLDRLTFEVLYVPPLRARGEDILLLANHFAAHMAYELGRPAAPVFSPGVAHQLEGHPWRGNVRELKNVAERAVYRTAGPVIEQVEFAPFTNPYAACPEATQPPTSSPPPAPDANGNPRPFKEAVAEFEASRLREALAATRYNQRDAAEWLGLTYHQFRGLYRKYADRLTR